MLIPFAASGDEGCRAALRTLALPHLEKLAARLQAQPADEGDPASLSMPHERAIAQALGLQAPDGRIPWAAWQVQQAGRDTRMAAWAWLTPCHWRVGMDHVRMDHPQNLQLDPRDSQKLLAAMAPYFEEDGVRVEYDAPTRWLARGELFRQLPTASLDRVVGRVIDGWLPQGAAAAPLRRLQQEMQMLLYTHPVNEERVRGGLLPVNSFWVSGTGGLPASHPPSHPPGLQVTHSLRDAALLGDWAAWAARWQQLDSQECARLLALLERGESIALTLCGERAARTWQSAPQGGLARRFKSLFGRKAASTLLGRL